MNLPTILVLTLVAALLGLALWLNHRSGRKLTDCGCNTKSCPRTSCQGCHGCDFLKQTK
jgi:hypothetical protein